MVIDSYEAYLEKHSKHSFGLVKDSFCALGAPKCIEERQDLRLCLEYWQRQCIYIYVCVLLLISSS
jgi:hypothetical protein